MKNPEVLAIITGRGGSKGVPGKNIKVLLGEPLIFYTIEEAKKSKRLTRFIVSTDDEKIANVARSFGVDVPFMRPKEFATDTATDIQYLQHAVDWLRDNEGYSPDIILRLPPTSPLRRAEHIDEGVRLLIDAGDSLDSVRPIVEVPRHPYKMWTVLDEKSMEPFIKPYLQADFQLKEPWNEPRQRLPKVYVHTGAMDIMWRKTLEEKKSTSGDRVGYFFMSPEDSVNIDSPIDFKLAEILMAERMNL